ncbi:hypothetical protein [Zavarzinia sp.]|uniref:hypothetical protein n=1 Tax=Zavarzinia sp. TaxID=2027920 RepID=UPI0035648A66
MFRRLELIDEEGVGAAMVYETEAAAVACHPPLRRYAVTAEPAPGQSRYDALLAVMAAQDPEG